jgi:hypothetical protein
MNAPGLLPARPIVHGRGNKARRRMLVVRRLWLRSKLRELARR